MLVWNSFKDHISDVMKEQPKQYYRVKSFVPGRCNHLTSALSNDFNHFFANSKTSGFLKESLNIQRSKIYHHPATCCRFNEAWCKVSKDAGDLFNV